MGDRRLRRLAGPKVAHVAGVPVTVVRARLNAAGVTSQSDTQSVQDLVGADMGQQMRTLGKVFVTNDTNVERGIDTRQ